jgi:hypothetical protein
MLAADIKRLRDTFEGWTYGRPYPTVEAWQQFRRELKELSFKVAMLELGVDLTVVDVAVEVAKPDTRVVLFPVNRTRRPIEPGEGQAS